MEDNFFEDGDAQIQSIPQDKQNQYQEYDQSRDNNNINVEFEGNTNQQQQQYQQFGVGEQAQVQLQSENHFIEEITQEMLEMRRKDEQINIRLQKKRADQQRLKQQRKQKGKQQLEKIKRVSQIQQNKDKNRSEAINSKQGKIYNNQWAKISDNIGIKGGEYPGVKDITRMRDAILRKVKDQK